MVEVLKKKEKQRNKYAWLELHMQKTVLCTGLNGYTCTTTLEVIFNINGHSHWWMIQGAQTSKV